jgi:phage baseplate assembly protein W
MATRKFYGYPWRIENGRIQAIPLAEYVKHQISERLMQPLGKRFFQEHIGSRLYLLEQVPINAVLYSAVSFYIYDALRNLPIVIRAITPVSTGQGQLEIVLSYALESGENQQFVFNLTNLGNG